MNLNRRKSPRIDARIQVQFKSGDEFIACYSENISKGGIYLNTPVQPDPNATIEIILHPPATVRSPNVTLFGRVVRIITTSEEGQTVHKVALQFLNLSPQIQAQLDLLYDEISTGSA